MRTNRKYTSTGFRFKPSDADCDPFPPMYYEIEKNAKAKLAQMTQLPKVKRP